MLGEARHLFRIDADFQVQVAADFCELSGPDYGIRRFHGQPLRLPQRREWWPDAENLAAQRQGASTMMGPL